VRLEWLYSIGATKDEQGDGPVIVNAFCNFIRQLEYPGNVLAKHYVASPGRTSFEAYITLERADEPDVLYASGGGEDGVGELPARASRCRCRTRCGGSSSDDDAAATPIRVLSAMTSAGPALR
jgi:acyl-CoA thioester hydrolase